MSTPTVCLLSSSCQLDALAVAGGAGNQRAQIEVIARLQGVIHRAMRDHVFAGDREDCEQDISIALLRAMRRFDLRRNRPFVSYAQKTIEGTIKKRGRGRREHSSLDDFDPCDGLQNHEIVADTRAMNPECGATGLETLRRMSSALKEVLCARLAGHTDEEIAARRGCTRRTIESAARAIRDLAA